MKPCYLFLLFLLLAATETRATTVEIAGMEFSVPDNWTPGASPKGGGAFVVERWWQRGAGRDRIVGVCVEPASGLVLPGDSVLIDMVARLISDRLCTNGQITSWEEFAGGEQKGISFGWERLDEWNERDSIRNLFPDKRICSGRGVAFLLYDQLFLIIESDPPPGSDELDDELVRFIVSGRSGIYPSLTRTLGRRMSTRHTTLFWKDSLFAFELPASWNLDRQEELMTAIGPGTYRVIVFGYEPVLVESSIHDSAFRDYLQNMLKEHCRDIRTIDCMVGGREAVAVVGRERDRAVDQMLVVVPDDWGGYIQILAFLRGDIELPPTTTGVTPIRIASDPDINRLLDGLRVGSDPDER